MAEIFPQGLAWKIGKFTFQDEISTTKSSLPILGSKINDSENREEYLKNDLSLFLTSTFSVTAVLIFFEQRSQSITLYMKK